MRGDISGNGRTDLILVYSRLSRQHPNWFAGGAPPEFRHDFVPQAAFLKIVQANGTSETARVPQTRAAWIDAISHVNDDPGGEIFLEAGRSSSGGWMLAYGSQDGKLLPAGVTLGYGGDSADGAGLNCLPGNPPRLVQRTYSLIGPTIYAWWRETDIRYAWHGPRLVQHGERSFKRYGAVTSSQTSIGRGCTAAGIH